MGNNIFIRLLSKRQPIHNKEECLQRCGHFNPYIPACRLAVFPRTRGLNQKEPTVNNKGDKSQVQELGHISLNSKFK